MGDYAPTYVKGKHKKGCGGVLARRPDILCIDRTGRIGNGGIVAHDYLCNRHWDGCKARVLVAEKAVRALAVDAYFAVHDGGSAAT